MTAALEPGGPLARARRLVHLIQRQVTGSRSNELLADLDQYDLLTYRLQDLCHLAGLPERLGAELERARADIAVDLLKKRITIDRASALVASAKSTLVELGADPDDRSLDSPSERLEGVRAAARALRPQLMARGVSAVYVFGSVSRGEDGPDSDVDLALEVSPGWDRFSALDLGWALTAFQELLETKVDIVELSSLSDRMRARIEPDLRQVM